MAQHKVIDLINQFMEDHGQSSGKDRVMLWLEDVYQKIRRLPWSWNFTTTETQTGGDYVTTPIITSDPLVETFAWIQGTDYIESTASTVASVTGYHTGRYIYIDDEWYKCTRISPTGDTDKVYLDKKVVATSSALNTVSFYRRDLAFQTNGIKSLHIDDQKINNLTDEQIYRFKRGLDPRWYYGDSGTPLAYHLDEYQIDPPLYPPVVTLSSSPTATPTLGVHRAFWVFVDSETGLESAPGPSVEFVLATGAERAVISYGSLTGHSSVETSHFRRLYITKSISSYTRVPAFQWQTLAHDSTASALPFEEADDSALLKSNYYDGSWIRAVLYPAPDEYLRALALHIDTWPGLPEEDEIIKLGRQREFIELFHLYFLMKQSIQNKDPQQFRGMQGAFREQMNFLLAQDGDDRRLDPSSWEYRFFSPTDVTLDSELISSLKYPF